MSGEDVAEDGGWRGRPKAAASLSQHEELGFYPKWDGTQLGFKVGERHTLIYVLK